jgi:hypothetical protein
MTGLEHDSGPDQPRLHEPFLPRLGQGLIPISRHVGLIVPWFSVIVIERSRRLCHAVRAKEKAHFIAQTRLLLVRRVMGRRKHFSVVERYPTLAQASAH